MIKVDLEVENTMKEKTEDITLDEEATGAEETEETEETEEEAAEATVAEAAEEEVSSHQEQKCQDRHQEVQ